MVDTMEYDSRETNGIHEFDHKEIDYYDNGLKVRNEDYYTHYCGEEECSTTIYEYDINGNLITETNYPEIGNCKELNSYSNSFISILHYSNEGNLILEELYHIYKKFRKSPLL